MNITINSVHFKADQKLEAFIQSKVEKLSGLFDGIIGTDVILKLEKIDSPENKIAEVKLLIRGNDLYARKQCKTFEEAADQAIEALRKQLEKHKEKLRGK